MHRLCTISGRLCTSISGIILISNWGDHLHSPQIGILAFCWSRSFRNGLCGTYYLFIFFGLVIFFGMFCSFCRFYYIVVSKIHYTNTGNATNLILISTDRTRSLASFRSYFEKIGVAVLEGGRFKKKKKQKNSLIYIADKY